MDKVIAFIDGFNMYHSIVEAKCSRLKWLNYWSFAEAFIARSKEKLVKVYYFSAITPWDSEKAARHKTYIRALEMYNVEAVLGKFKTVSRKCRSCGDTYQTFEEKETDVNIAVTMLAEATLGSYDKALLFSGDSDLLAAVRAVKKAAPHKSIHVVVPFKRNSIDLVNNCHFNSRVKLAHLQKNQLPDRIELGAGSGKFIDIPATWKC